MENIFTTSKPFLSLMKFSGLFPMSFVGNPLDGNFRVKPANVIITSLSTLFLLAATVFNLIYGAFVSSPSKILFRSWNMTMKLEFLCHVILFAFQIHHRTSLVSFLEHIGETDTKVKQNI